MTDLDLPAVLLTSMHAIAYYSGFLYCSFGRPYGCVVTPERCVTVSANIDGAQPWRRSVSENVVYTDWRRDNYWRTVREQLERPARLGIEGDHLTLAMRERLDSFFDTCELVDIAPRSMSQRMLKSDEVR